MRHLVAQAQSGGIGAVRAASRLISLLEDDPTILPELFGGMGKWPEPRMIVGVTGAPGVGKSSLVDSLLVAWRKKYLTSRLGVLAVDPSSPFTGGAVLGDRVRMMQHANDENIFIRSLASRGHLGGLTLGIKGAVRVMGLVGCDIVLIETVGVGQSEVEVAGVADMTLIALAPGGGDGIQMLKAGLMEAGDIFVVNKADREGADKLLAELSATLALIGRSHAPTELTAVAPDEMTLSQRAAMRRRKSKPFIFKASAHAGIGIDELVEGLEGWSRVNAEEIRARRDEAIRDEVRKAILESARRKVDNVLGHNGHFSEKVENVLAGRIGVSALAEQLMRTATQQ